MIERLYPGVYLAEVELEAVPIDGVQTTPGAAPAWAEPNAHDPGVTLLELLGFAAEPLSAATSKYVGETEKNLGTLFRDAAPNRALLRYDDTDALFGKCDD